MKSTKKEKRIAKALKKRDTKVNYDLFDNPMIRSIIKQMTPEQIEEYKNIGKELYGNIDFEKSEVLANLPPPMEEALAYIKEGLKSGLLPDDLDNDEITLLKEVYGEQWHKAFNFTDDDVKNIKVTDQNVIEVKLPESQTSEPMYGPRGAETIEFK